MEARRGWCCEGRARRCLPTKFCSGVGNLETQVSRLGVAAEIQEVRLEEATVNKVDQRLDIGLEKALEEGVIDSDQRDEDGVERKGEIIVLRKISLDPW